LTRPDLSLRLLHTAKHASEVPEARLGDHIVAGEDLHLVETRIGITLSRQLSTDDDELLELKKGEGCSKD
jgi:hypothetical protein